MTMNDYLDDPELKRWEEKRKAAQRGLFLVAGSAFVFWCGFLYMVL